MKIMVVDTVGGNRFSDTFKAYFPNAHLRGLEMQDDGACHPHGYQCGYYAGVLTALLPEKAEIVFVRIFDGKGLPVKDINQWLIDTIQKEKPDYLSHSWGQADNDSRFGETVGNVMWGNFSEVYKKVCASFGGTSFFAAGNDDRNDLDMDIDYPQRLMNQDVAIIGSHNRAGIPSVFSGDGHVMCSMWGENVALLSNDQWHRGSGTSFACPKAAGLAAYLGFDLRTFREYAEICASRPDDYSGLIPNVKWGYGSLEHKYQEYLARLPEELQPPHISPRIKMTEWKDFHEEDPVSDNQ